jgi:hypothetical protein
MYTAGTDYWKAAECQYLFEVCCQVTRTATTARNLLTANRGRDVCNDFYGAAV